MKPTIALLSLALYLTAGGCVRITHVDGCDGGVVIIPGEPAHGQVLYVLNLERSDANLVGPYAGLIGHLNDQLSSDGVVVDQYAVLPIYGGVQGAPALIYGVPSTGAGDLSTALAPATTSGFFDTPLAPAEQFNLATIAGALDAATLPPELTDGQSRPFFSPVKDLFLIVTIQPARRLCADTDAACDLAGQTPLATFSAAAQDGTAAWLRLPGGSYPTGRVYQVFLTTGEGESTASFQARCSAVPGFPKALLDVMEPSPALYYRDLASGLGGAGWHAEQLDLCDALGSGGPDLVKALAKRIAQAAGH